MATRPLIQESLYVLNICGGNPNNWNKYSKVKFTISVTIIVALAVEILMTCIYNWKGINSMTDVVVFLAMYQVTIQLTNLIITRRITVDFLRKMDQFWQFDKYPTGIEEEIVKRFTFLRKCIKIYGFYVLLLSLIFIIKPLVLNIRELPFSTYHPKNVTDDYVYYSAYFLQMFMLYPSVSVTIGFVSLFVAFIINITTELAILKEGLAQLPINQEKDTEDEEALMELRELIQHHSLILQCVGCVDRIYQMVLLNLFLGNMVLVCISLLGIIADGFPPKAQILFQYGMNATMYLGQLFFYCMMGTYLTNETENVSLAIYQTNWWIKFQPRLSKECLLMIVRANQPEQLTAGGMIHINLINFTRILRSILSFFTFMQAFYDEKPN